MVIARGIPSAAKAGSLDSRHGVAEATDFQDFPFHARQDFHRFTGISPHLGTVPVRGWNQMPEGNV